MHSNLVVIFCIFGMKIVATRTLVAFCHFLMAISYSRATLNHLIPYPAKLASRLILCIGPDEWNSAQLFAFLRKHPEGRQDLLCQPHITRKYGKFIIEIFNLPVLIGLDQFLAAGGLQVYFNDHPVYGQC